MATHAKLKKKKAENVVLVITMVSSYQKQNYPLDQNALPDNNTIRIHPERTP